MTFRASIAGLCLSVLIGALSADEIITLEGEKISGGVDAITSSGVLSGDGLPESLTLDGVRVITRAAKSIEGKPKLVVDTIAGGKLKASGITLANDKFTVPLVAGANLTLPLDAVRSIRFEPDLEMQIVAEALAAPSADFDRIFIKVEKNVESLKGLITSLDDAELKFEVDGQKQTLARERLHAIVLAQAPGTTNDLSLIQLADGSRVAAKPISLTSGELNLEVGATAKFSIPWDLVSRVDVQSSRMRYVSDVEPQSVKEEPVLTLPLAWQKDRSVGGKSLTVGKETFAKGLGVHARSELTFAIPEGFDTFLAVVGIDAETAGRGDCKVSILLDGSEALSQRVKANDQAVQLRLPLKNAKRMTLLVEPGADLDFADHLDWADARWIKTKKK